MVRKISFMILFFSLLVVPISLFSSKVVFNEYNHTGILSPSREIFSFDVIGTVEPFVSRFETVYIPPKVRGLSLDLPESTAIVLENGVTIGVDVGDIRVPNDILNELLSCTDCTFTYDNFPVEVFSIDRVVIKGDIDRKKLREYLSLFFESFELPGRIEETINVTPTPPTVDVYKAYHPLVGTVVLLRVTDESTFTVLWNERTGKLWYQTIEATSLHIKVVDSLGLDTDVSLNTLSRSYTMKTFQSFLEFGHSLILPSYVVWYNPATGEKLEVFSPGFPGVYHLIGYDESGNFLVLRVLVQDTTPPAILSPEEITDFSSFHVKIFCDGQESERIPEGRHVVFVKAEDNFGNASSAFFVTNKPHSIKIRENPVLIYFGSKKRISVGEFSTKGNIVFGWTREKNEVKVNGEIFELER
ncbi:hypothetical protein [Thermotoga sp. KOL6]|uniref:hypothetical protein n=1 Tax=Thermotoga sp. KOL6 TaxID=126741 RepID=UPI000C76B409|nr:hypothetical protein [Thermotoga sp. KOL6]PLV59742.1 hypothetical protein AS005_00115 [Thermotoga sp. KOL6]